MTFDGMRGDVARRGRRLRGWGIATSLAVAIVFATAPALGASLGDLRGHLSVGYGKLFATSAPGGSLAAGAGVDLPVTQGFRAGIEVGYMLLGTRTEESGSLIAELDYSLFEALLQVHWTPPWPGPLGIVSIGPGVFNARADLTSSGGAEFGDLPVAETRPGAAFGLTLIQRSAAPVRIGLEAGVRTVFLEKENWTLASARLTVHY